MRPLPLDCCSWEIARSSECDKSSVAPTLRTRLSIIYMTSGVDKMSAIGSGRVQAQTYRVHGTTTPSSRDRSLRALRRW